MDELVELPAQNISAPDPHGLMPFNQLATSIIMAAMSGQIQPQPFNGMGTWGQALQSEDYQ